MIELEAWPLDNKRYTSVALGAAYAARSRGLLKAESFSLTTNGDNTVTLAKGLGCLHVNEFWACFPYSKNDILVQFEDADGVYPRKDVIVLGYDKNANEAGIYVRTGVAAETPEMPELRQDGDYDETFLYCVNRPTGATSITPENVVDLRLDPTYCGLMRDTIDAIDTSVMQAAFEAFLAKIEQELDRLNTGTETMLKTTYDTKGRGVDVYDYGQHLYKATFLLDGWAGEGPYTQTVAVTPWEKDAPAITAASSMQSPVMIDDGFTGDIYDQMNEAGAIVNAGAKTFGAGTITCVTKGTDKPTCDVEVFFLAKMGGES